MKDSRKKLRYDKYIALLVNISKTTLISYKKDNRDFIRYKAYKSYFDNIINNLSEDDVSIYIDDMILFADDLKSLKILNKFTIL